MSRKTSTTPSPSPLFVRMGAAVSSMSYSLSPLDSKRVWSAKPTTFRSRKTLLTGFSMGLRVFLSTMSNTRSMDLPMASAPVQPVSDWATEFIKVTAPFMSVAITASPILPRVVESNFSLFARACCVCFRWESSRIEVAKTSNSSIRLTRFPARTIRLVPVSASAIS